jgi:hypothetical protein
MGSTRKKGSSKMVLDYDLTIYVAMEDRIFATFGAFALLISPLKYVQGGDVGGKTDGGICRHIYTHTE